MAAPTMSRVLVRRAGMFHTNAGPAIAPNTTTAKNRPLSRAYAISTVSASRSFWLRRPSLAVMEALSHGSRGLRTSVGPPHAAVFAVPAGAFHRVIVSVPGQAVVRDIEEQYEAARAQDLAPSVSLDVAVGLLGEE